jgi:hypothetical protein
MLAVFELWVLLPQIKQADSLTISDDANLPFVNILNTLK